MPEYCHDKAREALNIMMAGACAAGIAPIPGAMTVGLTVVQTAVVYRIARIYDFRVEAAGGVAALIAAILAKSGSAILMGRVAGEVANFVPLIGWAVKPAIGAGTTKAFGEATIAFFENIHPNKIYDSSKAT